MPTWLIVVIVLMLIAMSSNNKDTQEARQNSTEGYTNSEQSQQQFNQRIEECGTRCEDVKTDYNTTVLKE